VAPDYEPRNGPRPDKHQIDVLWVPVDELSQLNLVPADYADLLLGQQSRVYVGQLF
jgi:hypothetical protein